MLPLPSLRFLVLDKEEVGRGALTDEKAAVNEGGEFVVGVAARQAGEGHVGGDGDGVTAVEMGQQEGLTLGGGLGLDGFACRGERLGGTLKGTGEAAQQFGFRVKADAADAELRGLDVGGRSDDGRRLVVLLADGKAQRESAEAVQLDMAAVVEVADERRGNGRDGGLDVGGRQRTGRANVLGHVGELDDAPRDGDGMKTDIRLVGSARRSGQFLEVVLNHKNGEGRIENWELVGCASKTFSNTRIHTNLTRIYVNNSWRREWEIVW